MSSSHPIHQYQLHRMYQKIGLGATLESFTSKPFVGIQAKKTHGFLPVKTIILPQPPIPWENGRPLYCPHSSWPIQAVFHSSGDQLMAIKWLMTCWVTKPSFVHDSDLIVFLERKSFRMAWAFRTAEENQELQLGLWKIFENHNTTLMPNEPTVVLRFLNK